MPRTRNTYKISLSNLLVTRSHQQQGDNMGTMKFHKTVSQCCVKVEQAIAIATDNYTRPILYGSHITLN